MPVNPKTDPLAATAWADQFRAEVIDTSWNLLEQALHEEGLCSGDWTPTQQNFVQSALLAGATAMGVALERHGRLKEADDA